MPPHIMWFRRDLRLHDQVALDHAVRAAAQEDGGEVLPIFILDPHLVEHSRMSPARLVYLRDALADLDGSLRALGSALRVYHGRPAEVLPRLAQEISAGQVHVSADHTPFAVARDADVAERLQEVGCEWHAHPGVTIAEPGSVRTGSDTVYKVFTPFHRTWQSTPPGDPLAAPSSLPPIPRSAPAAPAVSDIDELDVAGPVDPWTDGLPGPADGGETAARERLEQWLSGPVDEYADARNMLAAAGTSRLSPDLHFGCLSPREILHRLDPDEPGHATFGTELAWRDFYLHVLAEWPHAAESAFRPSLADLRWREDPEGFEAWADGQTGYPVVDAAMRQLSRTGWMHNRARMIVASFLCKDLLIDWREGEAHFMANLVDGDTASNNGGWQWAAGTGTDAQPFIRIFNPTTQGRRFDPDGDYVRKFVPELASLPASRIHEPWRLSEEEQAEHGVVLGTDYPLPIVDHKEARERALAWWDGQM